MQMDGGYNERPLIWDIFIISSIICGIVVLYVLRVKRSWFGPFCLFLNLEGTLMWAFSLSPHGGPPPQGSWKDQISWFFQLAKGYTVTVNPKMFYAGILSVLVSAVLQALFKT